MGKHNRGFTLLEVLLAAILLTVGSVFLLEAISTGLFSSGINETELVAIILAQEKIESIRNTIYENIVDEAKAVVNGFPAFRREVIVATPQTGLKEVTVNVYYEVKRAELNISLVTYVSNA